MMARTMVPWTERLPRTLGRLEKDFGRFVDGILSDEDRWVSLEGAFVPMINVAENAEGVEVTVELPGMKPEDFAVEIKNGALWISGEKKEEKEEKEDLPPCGTELRRIPSRDSAAGDRRRRQGVRRI
jgi:HSP20 family protein